MLYRVICFIETTNDIYNVQLLSSTTILDSIPTLFPGTYDDPNGTVPDTSLRYQVQCVEFPIKKKVSCHLRINSLNSRVTMMATRLSGRRIFQASTLLPQRPNRLFTIVIVGLDFHSLLGPLTPPEMAWPDSSSSPVKRYSGRAGAVAYQLGGLPARRWPGKARRGSVIGAEKQPAVVDPPTPVQVC